MGWDFVGTDIIVSDRGNLQLGNVRIREAMLPLSPYPRGRPSLLRR